MSSTVFCEVIKEFSLLEELELVIKSDTWASMKVSTRCWAELLQAACEASSHLKCFTVRHAGDSNSNGYYCVPPRICNPNNAWATLSAAVWGQLH